jgi:hypothetical protein
MVAIPVTRYRKQPTYYRSNAFVSDYTAFENNSMIFISYKLSFTIPSQKCVFVKGVECNVLQECPDKNYSNGTILDIYSTRKNCDYFFKNPNKGFTSGEITMIVFGVIFMLPLLAIIGMSGANPTC